MVDKHRELQAAAGLLSAWPMIDDVSHRRGANAEVGTLEQLAVDGGGYGVGGIALGI